MLEIKQIEFRNFRSYGKNVTKVVFDKPGATIIVGKSETNETTNGHGKTSIPYCIFWLLYDQIIENIPVDSLINNVNKCDLWGRILFADDEQLYAVERWRKGGKSKRENGVKLSRVNVDGTEEDITPASIKDTNAEIERIVGIDFEMFSRIVIFSASNKSFFELPTTSASGASQSDMIEQLFDLEVLSNKATKLKEQIKATDSELNIQERLIKQAAEQVSTHKNLVERTQIRLSQWDKITSESKRQVAADLELINKVDFEAEKKLHNTLTECANVEKELNSDLRVSKQQLNMVEGKLDELNHEVEKLDKAICPYCDQKFANTADKLKVVQAHISKYTNARTEVSGMITELSSELARVVALIEKTQRKTQVDNFEKLVELNAKHHELVKKFDEYKTAVNPHIESLQELKAAVPVAPDYNSINTLTTLSEHQQFLLKLLTKKDSFIRKNLLNKNLPYLNERLDVYLKELGLPHTCEFTPSLTPLITQFGREIGYQSLSRGQKSRINFALSLAFSDVLQILHRKISIQLFDEVLDLGLCPKGVADAVRVLKNKATSDKLSLYVITHKEEVQSSFEATLVVRFIDGFSQIEQ